MKGVRSGAFHELGASRATRAWERLRLFNRRYRYADFLAAFVFSFLLVLMVRHDSSGNMWRTYKEGEVAQSTVRMKRPVEIEDLDATEAQRQQLISKLPLVYDYDTDAFHSVGTVWKGAVQSHRQAVAKGATKDPRADFAAKLGVEVLTEEYRVLERLGFTPALEGSIYGLTSSFWDLYVTESRVGGSNLELNDLKSGASRIVKSREAETFSTLDELRTRVTQLVSARSLPKMPQPWNRWDAKDAASVAAVQVRLLRPNVTLNKKEFEARKADALKDFRPLVQRLEKGEVLVREGERVSRRAAQIMAEFAKVRSRESHVGGLLAEALFCALSLGFVLMYLRRQYPYVLSRTKDVWVGAGLLLTSLASLKLLLVFQLEILAEQFQGLPVSFFLFLIPVATPAMVSRLLLGPRLTLFFSVLHASCAALLLERAGLFGIYVLVSSFVGSVSLSQCKTRGSLYRAGLWASAACAVLAVCLVAAWGGRVPLSSDAERVTGWPVYLWTFAAGAIAGWLSSALTLVLTPLLENLLDYTTDLKLLELARMDHPLLRDLVVKAPGTYHHSIIVGSLAEAGCEAVGANALLTRVGAYYHDIGKIGRAEYFVENQAGGPNPHDHTRPQLSAKIIISHVKEGKVMAERHKLGKALVDFIETHHGTTLVSYFYNKAKQEAAKPDSPISPEEVVEEDFRYPGPKPQTKEMAILALADSCEAATRSLVDPTPARIDGMVKKIVQRAFQEGTLDEAEITLREVNLVSQAFIRILLGIHHNRIQYPDQERDLPPAPGVVRFGRK
jgi:putative nucleotidyltransferase with HDIG domain